MAETMRAVGVNAFGGPEVLEMLEQPVPEPGEGEAVVKLVYAGINFIDVYMRSGHYARSDTYKTPLPMVLGMEGAGHVAKLGPGVSGLKEGDAVAWCIHRGAYADYAAVPAWRLVKVPEDVPLDIATTLQLQGCTAHYLTHSAFALKQGDICLAHAGAGGVGQLLTQLAKMRGATVIVTVGSQDKAEIAKALGADHVILYAQEDFRERVMEITGGRGVDVVYDSVGKDTFMASLESLALRGTMVLFGASSGAVEPLDPQVLNRKGSLYLTRPSLFNYIDTRAELLERAGDVFSWAATGELDVKIDSRWELAEAADAHRHLESRKSSGKLLIVPARG
jgi:NADPH2:quinone reductase